MRDFLDMLTDAERNSVKIELSAPEDAKLDANQARAGAITKLQDLNKFIQNTIPSYGSQIEGDSKSITALEHPTSSLKYPNSGQKNKKAASSSKSPRRSQQPAGSSLINEYAGAYQDLQNVMHIVGDPSQNLDPHHDREMENSSDLEQITEKEEGPAHTDPEHSDAPMREGGLRGHIDSSYRPPQTLVAPSSLPGGKDYRHTASSSVQGSLY